LRFQLIEGRAMAQSDIKITFEDLKAFYYKKTSEQMAQYGQTNPTDEEVQGIVAFVKPRRSEKLSDQVVAEKLLELFKKKSKSNN
jgi:trigger factor